MGITANLAVVTDDIDKEFRDIWRKYMKMTRLVLFCLLGIAILWYFASAEPQLSIPDAVFNFGYAPQNSTITHVFWLHSTGTDSLKIIKVSPG